MAEFGLRRVAVVDEGAFGVLLHQGLPFAVSLERTFADGSVVIPPGRYELKRTVFYRGSYPTYEVAGVSGHSRLLIHKGNVEGDSEGCILTGRRFGTLRGKPAVLESRLAFEDFMRLSQDPSHLQVTN